MGSHGGLADYVGALQVLKSAVEISSGNELPAKGDFAVETEATLRVHPSRWHSKPCRAGRADI
jgi:hypothetical protein